MKSHIKARSMIMVSPHTKMLSLEVNVEKRTITKPNRIFHKSFQDQKKEIILFKLIQNQFPPNSNFSPSKEANSDPFRMPTRTRERKQKKLKDFDFRNLYHKAHEKLPNVKTSPEPPENRKVAYEQVHYVKKYKSKVTHRKKISENPPDGALVISKKKILPAVSSRNQFFA